MSGFTFDTTGRTSAVSRELTTKRSPPQSIDTGRSMVGGEVTDNNACCVAFQEHTASVSEVTPKDVHETPPTRMSETKGELAKS
jgi:hypothetical protein